MPRPLISTQTLRQLQRIAARAEQDAATVQHIVRAMDAGGAPTTTVTSTTVACLMYWPKLELPLGTAIDVDDLATYAGQVYRVAKAPPASALDVARTVELARTTPEAA